MEELHKIGKIYNNLSLSNIVTINEDKTFNGKGTSEATESITSVMLTNFSSCSDFLDAAGNHI